MSITPDTGYDAPGQTPEYTYLTVPAASGMRSTLGIVLAGLAARAEVGVGGLEEAVQTLEDAYAFGGHTSYRFALEGSKVLAQVEQAPPEGGGADGRDEAGRWRTLVELIS